MHNNITIDSHCLGAQPSVIKNHGSNCPQMKRQIKECYFSCISYLVQNIAMRRKLSLLIHIMVQMQRAYAI